MNKECWLINKFIAHRGFHTETEPENSLGAFANAIEMGYAIELDIHQLIDGQLVVFHDEQLSRMTGKDGYVTNLTSSELSNYHLNGTEYHIPLLSEVFELVAGRTPILIEVKNTGKVGKLEAELVKLINDYQGEVAIQAFNPYVLEWTLQNAPNILRGQLACSFKGERLAFLKKFILRRLGFVRKVRADFISYYYAELPNRFVSKFRNIPVIAWTVKSQARYEDVAPYCANIIFENFEPSRIE